MTERWTLHHGDCLDPVTGMASLPDGSVDVVITDPPYSEHVHAKQWIGAALTANGAPGVATAHAGLGFTNLTRETASACVDQWARLARRWVLVFCDLEGAELWRSVGAPLEYVRTCIWDKIDSAPQFTGDRPANGAEAIVVFSQPGKKRWNGGGKRNVYRYAVNADRGPKPHPSTKPLALMQELVRDFTDPGELILDPFAGSGTTGVAALGLGRRFVGWEQNAEWHAGAIKRLAAVREQPGLFDARPKQPKPKQAALFGGKP